MAALDPRVSGEIPLTVLTFFPVIHPYFKKIDTSIEKDSTTLAQIPEHVYILKR